MAVLSVGAPEGKVKVSLTLRPAQGGYSMRYRQLWTLNPPFLLDTQLEVIFQPPFQLGEVMHVSYLLLCNKLPKPQKFKSSQLLSHTVPDNQEIQEFHVA